MDEFQNTITQNKMQKQQRKSTASSYEISPSLNRDVFAESEDCEAKYTNEKDDSHWNVIFLRRSKEELLDKIQQNQSYNLIDKSILCKIINYHTEHFKDAFDIDIVYPTIEDDLKSMLLKQIFKETDVIQGNDIIHDVEYTPIDFENLEKFDLFTQEEEEEEEQISLDIQEDDTQEEEEEEEMIEAPKISISKRKQTFNPKNREEKIEKQKQKIEKQKKMKNKRESSNETSKLDIPKEAMNRLIREIADNFQDVRFEANALLAIHECAEAFLVDLFDATNQVSSISKKITIEPEHLRLAINLSRKNLI